MAIRRKTRAQKKKKQTEVKPPSPSLQDKELATYTFRGRALRFQGPIPPPQIMEDRHRDDPSGNPEQRRAGS
jgi:hypothetical protein